MRAETPEELIAAMRWGHVAMLFWLVSIIWFVAFYLGAGRRWLAWTISGLRTFYLVHRCSWLGPNVNYREITSLRRVPFLGESVTVSDRHHQSMDAVRPVDHVDDPRLRRGCRVAAWRRGDRRKALMVGGGVEFFLLLGSRGRPDVLGQTAGADYPQPVLPGPGRR